jgi:hypothetical protein
MLRPLLYHYTKGVKISTLILILIFFSQIYIFSDVQEAIDTGLTPNRFMFNAAMGGCAKPEQIFELYSRMQIAGIGVCVCVCV